MYMLKKFMNCGIVGWCLEIIFTALNSFRTGDFKFMGNTSLWMFPIYGMAVFLLPISKFLKGKSVLLRGSIYTCCIFATEFCTGILLKALKICPWSYDGAPFNIAGVIRLDYAPYWFGTGLLYEYLLNKPETNAATND